MEDMYGRRGGLLMINLATRELSKNNCAVEVLTFNGTLLDQLGGCHMDGRIYNVV